jgi:uncharacterized damage-inducible protein DinB
MDLPLMKTRAALALAEETETARRNLYRLLPRFPEDALARGDVEREDNVRGILCHVTSAIYSYSCWMRRVRGRLDAAVEKEDKARFLARVRSLVRAAEFEEASRWASAHYYDTLAEVEKQDMELEFKSNWGETISIELMMEHALVHLLRHRRQLEILLGDRPQRPIRES